MPLSQPADACLAFIAAQPHFRMLLSSCSNDHYGLFGSKDLRINLNPQICIYEFSCGYLCPMPAVLSCGEVYTQFRLRVGTQSDGSQCFGSSAASEAVSIWGLWVFSWRHRPRESVFSRAMYIMAAMCSHYNAIEWSFAIYRPEIYQPLVGHSIRGFINISAVDFHRPTQPIPSHVSGSRLYTHTQYLRGFGIQSCGSQCLESSAASAARSILVKWAMNSIWTRSWY
jgi:hypothetical protein